MEASSGGLRPQTMNVADCTRGQVEQVLRLQGIAIGALTTAAYSLKPGAPFALQEAGQDLVLWVLQGVGTCEVRDAVGNQVGVRLRRGTHLTVPRGSRFRLENAGRALLMVIQAAGAR